jgi:hypothetical protein
MIRVLACKQYKFYLKPLLSYNHKYCEYYTINFEKTINIFVSKPVQHNLPSYSQTDQVILYQLLLPLLLNYCIEAALQYN